MKITVEFETYSDIIIDEKDLPDISEKIEECEFVRKVNRIEID